MQENGQRASGAYRPSAEKAIKKGEKITIRHGLDKVNLEIFVFMFLNNRTCRYPMQLVGNRLITGKRSQDRLLYNESSCGIYCH